MQGRFKGGLEVLKGLTEVRGITSREGPGGLEIGAGSVIAGGGSPLRPAQQGFARRSTPGQDSLPRRGSLLITTF